MNVEKTAKKIDGFAADVAGAVLGAGALLLLWRMWAPGKVPASVAAAAEAQGKLEEEMAVDAEQAAELTAGGYDVVEESRITGGNTAEEKLEAAIEGGYVDEEQMQETLTAVEAQTETARADYYAATADEERARRQAEAAAEAAAAAKQAAADARMAVLEAAKKRRAQDRREEAAQQQAAVVAAAEESQPASGVVSSTQYSAASSAEARIAQRDRG